MVAVRVWLTAPEPAIEIPVRVPALAAVVIPTIEIEIMAKSMEAFIISFLIERNDIRGTLLVVP
jgi:hypothetical protein